MEEISRHPILFYCQVSKGRALQLNNLTKSIRNVRMILSLLLWCLVFVLSILLDETRFNVLVYLTCEHFKTFVRGLRLPEYNDISHQQHNHDQLSRQSWLRTIISYEPGYPCSSILFHFQSFVRTIVIHALMEFIVD